MMSFRTSEKLSPQTRQVAFCASDERPFSVETQVLLTCCTVSAGGLNMQHQLDAAPIDIHEEGWTRRGRGVRGWKPLKPAVMHHV